MNTINDSRDLLTRHLRSFQENDLDAIISDYTEQSVLITQKNTYKGIAEIRGFFSSIIVDFPKYNTKFDLDFLSIHDELAFIVWHATTPSIKIILGTDTFVIQDGKIHLQTFVDMVRFTS